MTDPLRRYTYCRYVDADKAISPQARAAVATAVCDEASRDRECTRHLYAYVARRYPRVTEDNPELLSAVRQAAGL